MDVQKPELLYWSSSPWSYQGSQVDEPFIIYNSTDRSALSYDEGDD